MAADDGLDGLDGRRLVLAVRCKKLSKWEQAGFLLWREARGMSGVPASWSADDMDLLAAYLDELVHRGCAG